MAVWRKIFNGVAPALKGMGRTIDSLGASLEAVPVVESLLPSTKAMAFEGKTPRVAECAFVAPTATLCGDVTVGKGSSVWYGAKIRGDVHSISIGANTSIGDCVMVHVAKIAGDHPTVIGDNVTVGANAVLHACTVGDNVVIGMGAQVLDGATVASGAVLAAGALVTPGKAVGPGELWGGAPAVLLRALTEAEAAAIGVSACEAAGLAVIHKAECAKDFSQVLVDLELAADKEERHPDYFVRTDPALADVPIIEGGTMPHAYEQNDRMKTKFEKHEGVLAVPKTA